MSSSSPGSYLVSGLIALSPLLIVVSVLVANKTIFLFVLSIEINNWCPAKGTTIIALLDPVLQALGVKVVALVTPQLCDSISLFIIN